MKLESSDEYECCRCNRAFRQRARSLTRKVQRFHVDLNAIEVGIAGSEGLACYCSSERRAMHVPVAVAGDGVPIAAVRPAVDPMEKCTVRGVLVGWVLPA
jgi:hypothetical protein